MNTLRTKLFGSTTFIEGDPAPAGGAGGKSLSETLYPDGGGNPDAGKPDPAPVDEPKAEDAPKKEPKAEEPPKEEEPKKEDEPKAEDKPEEAPALKAEDYKIDLPEGATADDTLMTSFRTEAAAAGLTQEAAQKFANMYFQGLKSQVEAVLGANLATFQETQKAWQDEIKAAPEFATPATMKESQQIIGSFIDEFADDPTAVRDALNLTGAGNNPALVKLFLSVGKALKEGTVTPQGKPPGKRTPRSLGEVLYPDQKQG